MPSEAYNRLSEAPDFNLGNRETHQFYQVSLPGAGRVPAGLGLVSASGNSNNGSGAFSQTLPRLGARQEGGSAVRPIDQANPFLLYGTSNTIITLKDVVALIVSRFLA